jgi:hypothetical protein
MKQILKSYVEEEDMSITTSLLPKHIKHISFSGNGWRIETNASIYFLLKMAKKNKSWRDFTKKEIDEVAKEDFWFNDLGEAWINRNTKSTKYRGTTTEKISSYSFTDKFILMCKEESDREEQEKNKN